MALWGTSEDIFFLVRLKCLMLNFSTAHCSYSCHAAQRPINCSRLLNRFCDKFLEKFALKGAQLLVPIPICFALICPVRKGVPRPNLCPKMTERRGTQRVFIFSIFSGSAILPTHPKNAENEKTRREDAELSSGGFGGYDFFSEWASLKKSYPPRCWLVLSWLCRMRSLDRIICVLLCL